MKASGVIGEGSDSFPIVEEFEAKKKGIRCAVYSKLLKLTLAACLRIFFFGFFILKKLMAPHKASLISSLGTLYFSGFNSGGQTTARQVFKVILRNAHSRTCRGEQEEITPPNFKHSEKN